MENYKISTTRVQDNMFLDSYCTATEDEIDFLNFMQETMHPDKMDKPRWDEVTTNEIRFVSIEEDPELVNLCTEDDVLNDTFSNTGICAVVNEEFIPVRDCAIKTILDRCKVSGSALFKVRKSVLADILNKCIAVQKGKSLVRYENHKITAIHGGDNSEYVVLPQEELFTKASDYLNENFDSEFRGGYFDHSLSTAVWVLHNDAMLEHYNAVLEAHGITKKTLTPAVRLSTSDAGISGANLFPTLKTESGEIALGSPLKLEHKNSASMSKFEANLEMLFAHYQTAIGELAKLMDIEIQHPVNTLLGVCKRIGVGKKLSFLAAELFKAQNGDVPCTAHDVYFGISEVLNIMRGDGETEAAIAKMEETVSRAFTVRWTSYDHPGDAKW